MRNRSAYYYEEHLPSCRRLRSQSQDRSKASARSSCPPLIDTSCQWPIRPVFGRNVLLRRFPTSNSPSCRLLDLFGGGNGIFHAGVSFTKLARSSIAFLVPQRRQGRDAVEELDIVLPVVEAEVAFSHTSASEDVSEPDDDSVGGHGLDDDSVEKGTGGNAASVFICLMSAARRPLQHSSTPMVAPIVPGTCGRLSTTTATAF